VHKKIGMQKRYKLNIWAFVRARLTKYANCTLYKNHCGSVWDVRKGTETAHLSVGRGKTNGRGGVRALGNCDVSCAAQNLVTNGTKGTTKKGLAQPLYRGPALIALLKYNSKCASFKKCTISVLESAPEIAWHYYCESDAVRLIRIQASARF
jgi:hypothetical protein